MVRNSGGREDRWAGEEIRVRCTFELVSRVSEMDFSERAGEDGMDELLWEDDDVGAALALALALDGD